MYVESNCLSYLLPWWNGKNKRCVCGWVTERAQTLGCETQHQPRWVELRRAGSLLQRSEIFFFVAALWPEPGFTWSKWVLISMTRGLCKVKFYFCNLKSQPYSLSGLYSLYRERHPLSLHPQFEKGSLPRKKKQKVRNLRRSHRTEIPLWTDRHAVDAEHTDQTNSINTWLKHRQVVPEPKDNTLGIWKDSPLFYYYTHITPVGLIMDSLKSNYQNC